MGKRERRERRKRRVRSKVFGTPDRPRLSIFRSLKHMYAQVIVDLTGETLVSASTVDPELRDEVENGGNKEAARKVGALIAKRALDRGIERVVLDRNGYKYHGRVAALAEGAREEGLEL